MSTSEKLIRDYYVAFNNHKWDEMLGQLSEDVQHDINQGGIEKGRDKFKAFLKVMDDHYDEKVSDLTIMVSKDGARAAAEFTISGRYLKSQKGLPEAKGQKYELPVGAFFKIENNKITRVTNYYNLPLWIKLVSQ